MARIKFCHLATLVVSTQYIPGEDWVSHANQDVVNAVQLHVLHAPLPHVGQDAAVAQGAVQAPVPVGRPDDEREKSISSLG